MEGATLVVGQGLAGTLISFRLYRAGKNFVVMDSGQEPCASRVAAGMWNPIGFRRLGFTWRVQEFLPIMLATYREIEEVAGKKFLFEVPVQKKIPGENYAREWEELRNSADYSSYLSPLYSRALRGDKFFQWGDVNGSGYLDIALLLDWWKDFLTASNQFRETSADYSQFKMIEDGVSYLGERFDRIIFCDGINVRQNPWFPGLPVQCNKGDVLSLRSEPDNIPGILNNGKFLLKMGDGRMKLGSTYEWWKDDVIPEEANREMLLQKAAELLPEPYTLIEHKTGLRPTVPDRRPVVGRSPLCSGMWLLNGLGTRGVMIGPYWAAHLMEMIFNHRPPDAETDPARFGK